MLRWVNDQKHRVRGGVVDRNEGEGLNNCIFKFLHCMVVLLLPDKLHILVYDITEKVQLLKGIVQNKKFYKPSEVFKGYII